jgi:hypothetical protein
MSGIIGLLTESSAGRSRKQVTHRPNERRHLRLCAQLFTLIVFHRSRPPVLHQRPHQPIPDHLLQSRRSPSFPLAIACGRVITDPPRLRLRSSMPERLTSSRAAASAQKKCKPSPALAPPGQRNCWPRPHRISESACKPTADSRPRAVSLRHDGGKACAFFQLAAGAAARLGRVAVPKTFVPRNSAELLSHLLGIEPGIERKRGSTANRRLNYTGTGTLSTISRSTCSACSDFFKVEV